MNSNLLADTKPDLLVLVRFEISDHCRAGGAGGACLLYAEESTSINIAGLKTGGAIEFV
jgi:hypothetical protein